MGNKPPVMARKPPAFQFYVKDWLSDDKRVEMSLAQRGIWVDLMAYQWNNGSVPVDAAGVAKVVGCSASEIEPHWTGPLLAAFPLANGGTRRQNPRLEEQRVEVEARRKLRSAAGKTGARKRWEEEG